MRRDHAGGVIELPRSQRLELRVFLDGSALEIFTGEGAALSTRVYRGLPHGRDATKLELRSVGTSALAASLEVHEVVRAAQGPGPGRDLNLQPPRNSASVRTHAHGLAPLPGAR